MCSVFYQSVCLLSYVFCYIKVTCYPVKVTDVARERERERERQRVRERVSETDRSTRSKVPSVAVSATLHMLLPQRVNTFNSH